MLTGLRDAAAFLTRVPLGAPGAMTPSRQARALGWFPAVGALVGAALGGTRLLLDLVLPAGPATLVALAVALVLTGALHEDGLADTFDGLGVHATPARRLEIMRDSRIGTFGALALAVALGLEWSLLSALDGLDCLRAAVVAHALGRWSAVPTSMGLRPARADGFAASLHAHGSSLAAASGLAVAVALAVAGPVAGLGALLAAGTLSAGAAAIALRAFGGATGDTYGATVKLVELGVLGVLVALVS